MVDLKSLTIRLREAKGGKDSIANISDEYANLLRQYLLARPPMSIDGRLPLFYTILGEDGTEKISIEC